MSVSNKDACEPFNRMLVTKNESKKSSDEVRKFNEKRKLTSTDGKVKERLEVSFYSD